MEERYLRNLGALSEEECALLRTRRVCVVGCGGLGGSILELLLRVGVGHITAVDGDRFDATNLNRQLLSRADNLGRSKVRAAAERAAAVNPGVSFRGIEGFLDRDNCRDIVAGHDLVMDALDSGEARLVLAEGCAAEGVPLIHGAIRGWYAQVAVVPPGSGLLRRLYRSGGGGGEDKSCLAFTPALCAALQTAEAVKLLCGRPGLPPGNLLMVDLLDQSYDVIQVESPARD